MTTKFSRFIRRTVPAVCLGLITLASVPAYFALGVLPFLIPWVFAFAVNGTLWGMMCGWFLSCFIPVRVRSAEDGTLITAAGQPELFGRIAKLALSLGQPVPEEIYLTCWVTTEFRQMGGFVGFGGKPVLHIGLPLLYFLNVSELDAALAQAFAYVRGDLPLSSWLFRARSRMDEIAGVEWRDIFPSAFVWYAKAFVRLTRPIHFILNREGDELAARTVGSRICAQALNTMDRQAKPFHTFLRRDVLRAVANGYHPSMMEGYRLYSRFAHGEPEESANPDFRDLPLEQRLRSIERLPAGKPADETPAISLLREALACERLVLRGSVRYSDGALVPITWRDMTNRVVLPAWYKACREFGPNLCNFKLADLPAIAADLDSFPRTAQLPNRRHWSPRLSKDLLTYALGNAIRNAGWQIHYSPGCVRLRRGASTIDPWQIVEDLSAAKFTAGEWRDMLDRYELNPDMPLAVA